LSPPLIAVPEGMRLRGAAAYREGFGPMSGLRPPLAAPAGLLVVRWASALPCSACGPAKPRGCGPPRGLRPYSGLRPPFPSANGSIVSNALALLQAVMEEAPWEPCRPGGFVPRAG